jgi:hypothetical protein
MRFIRRSTEICRGAKAGPGKIPSIKRILREKISKPLTGAPENKK